MAAPHICKRSRTCTCTYGHVPIEPREDCPVHGFPFPPRCGYCGRFLPLWKPGQSPTAPKLAARSRRTHAEP